MKAKNMTLAAALLLAALAGCISAPVEDKIPVNSTWTLESYGAIGHETAVRPGSTITLQFIEGGKIAGTAGCNRYFASYEQGPDGAISLGPAGSTMMYCEGLMDQEYAYLKALENVTSIEIGFDYLKLYYDESALSFAGPS